MHNRWLLTLSTLGVLALLSALLAFAPAAESRRGGDDVDQPLAACPAEVHDRHVTTGPDGRPYPTWHPAIDPVHKCAFGHEHGSDPRLYVGFGQSGMPAFGYAAAVEGMTEPHNGFKVFVANDDLHGRAWMITLHQGTGGPRRAHERYHSLAWHISTTSGQQLVSIHVMADFGHASPNCRRHEAIPGSGAGLPFSSSDAARRFVPTVDCARETPYESWTASVRIADLFEALPTFDSDNPTTVIDPSHLEQLRYMCEFRSPDEDCTSGQTQWKGDKRSVIHPGQYVSNQGAAEIYTDAFGRRISRNAPHAIRQLIAAGEWDTRDCCGHDVVFKPQSYSKGVFIAAPDEDVAYPFGDDTVHWPN